MSATKTIEVCERAMDHWIDSGGKRQPKYHAQLIGNAGIWSEGRTYDEAVGNLVRHHPEVFGVEVKLLGKLPR